MPGFIPKVQPQPQAQDAAAAPSPQPPDDPYAQFLSGPSAPAAASAAPGDDPYAQFAGQPDTRPTLGGIGRNYLAGANRVIADVAGAPADIVNALSAPLNPVVDYLANKLRGATGKAPLTDAQLSEAHQKAPLIGGSAQIKHLVGADIQPTNTAEEIAAGAGNATGAMATAIGGLGSLADSALVEGRPLLGSLFRALRGTGATAETGAGALARTATDLTAGAAAGGAGTAARKALPEDSPWGPLAETVGNVVGGAPVAAIAGLGESAIDAAGNVIRREAAPFLENGRQWLAANAIRGAAKEPGALAGKLDTDNPELVPGSQPTTFQQSGDLGVGQLERWAAAKQPEAFKARAAEQNAARVGAIRNTAPGGSPAAVGQYFRDQLDNIDQLGAQAEAGARARVASASGRIGGTQFEQQADYGAAMRHRVDEAYAPGRAASDQAIAGAQGDLDASVAAAGGTRFQSPGEYGAAVRSPLLEDANAAKSRASQLWQAIDPQGNLTFNVQPMKAMANGVRSAVPDVAKQPGGEEAAIYDAIGSLPPAASFQDAQAIRGRITDEIRAQVKAAGTTETPVIRRLMQLKNGLDASLQEAVERRAAQDEQDVAAGLMGQNETLAAGLQRATRQWYAERDASIAGGQGLTYGGAGSSGNAGTGPTPVRGVPGGKGPARGGPGDVQGSAGLPGQALPRQPLDEAAIARYQAARQATAEYKATYRDQKNAVGQVIAPGAPPFRVSDAQVPARFFNSKDTSPEAIAALVKASGSRPDAIDALQDYAAYDLRRTALENGKLNPAKFRKWVADHQEALSAFPELRAKFANIAKAQDALSDQLTRRAALEVGYPIRPGMADADVAAKFFNGTPRGKEAVAAYRSAVGGDQQAMGLLRDYAAYDLRKFAQIQPDGTLNPKRLATWLEKHDAALSAFPELKAQFADAGRAQQTLENALALRQDALKAYQKTAAGLFLGKDGSPLDPDVAVARAFGSPNPTRTFEDLVTLVSADKTGAASAGLKRAVVDYILRNYRGSAEAGDTGIAALKSAGYQGFIKMRAGPLKKLFGEEGFANLKAVADDLQRSNRSVEGTKLPGGSNTPQDLAAKARFDMNGSIMEHLASEGVGAAAGLHFGGPLGAALGFLGGKALSAMKARGLHKVEDLIVEAMLHPEVAKDLLTRFPSGRVPPKLGDLLAQHLWALGDPTAAAAGGNAASAVQSAVPKSKAPAQQQPSGMSTGGRLGLAGHPASVSGSIAA